MTEQNIIPVTVRESSPGAVAAVPSVGFASPLPWSQALAAANGVVVPVVQKRAPFVVKGQDKVALTSGEASTPGPSAAKKAKKAAKKAAKRAAKKAVKMEAKKIVGQGSYSIAQIHPRSRAIRGKGDYVDDAVNWTADKAGSLVKSGLSWLGGKARSWLGSLLGAGDYKMGKTPGVNSLFAGSRGVQSTDKHAFTIRHREYLASVQSSAGFQISSYSVNPGLPGVFTWGSQPAAAFQRYRVNGVLLEYVSRVAPYGGGNVNGTVAMAARYDVNLAAPTTSLEVENTEGSVSGRPTDNLIFGLECEPSSRQVNVLNIRTGNLPSGANGQFFDHAVIDIVNEGQADATSEIGRLYLVYDIDLLVPFDSDTSGSDVLSDHWQLESVTSAAPFGTSATRKLVTGSTLGTVIPTGTALLSFPSFVQAGKWLITISWDSVSASTVTAIVPTVTRGSLVTMWSTNAGVDTANFSRTLEGASVSRQSISMVIDVTDASPGVAISGTTFTGTTKGDIVVCQIAGTITTLKERRRHAALFSAAEFRRQEMLDDAMMIARNMLSLRDDEKHSPVMVSEPDSPVSRRSQSVPRLPGRK